MAPNNTTSGQMQYGIPGSEMAPNNYLRLVVESLSHVETTVRLLRTAVTTLCDHATFEPNKNIPMPNSTQLNDARMAMSNGNALLGSIDVQVVNTDRRTMENQNFRGENLPAETLRYSEDFMNGLSNANNATLIRAGCNTYTNMLVAGFNNQSMNSEQFACGSMMTNNTDLLLERVLQMENDVEARNEMVTGEEMVNGESTIENYPKIQEPAIAPAPAPAPATNIIETVDEKDDATQTAGEIKRGVNEINDKVDPPLKKRKLLISTEKVLQVFRHKGFAAANAKIRSNAQRRSSIASSRRSSVAETSRSITRLSFERRATPIAKPFKCAVVECSYAGACKRYLTAHMKRHGKGKLVDCRKSKKNTATLHDSGCDKYINIQMESYLENRKEIVIDEEKVNGESITENDPKIQEPAIAPAPAPGTNTIETVKEKDNAAQTAGEINRGVIELNEKVDAKIRSNAQRRSSMASSRRSSVSERNRSITRVSLDRTAKFVKPTPIAKTFKCVVVGCSYAGACKRYLTVHMKRHGKDKLVDCTKCEKKFKMADSDAFTKHLSEHN